MNVDSTLKALLDKLGVPVARLKYNGRAACFITYQLVVGRDTLFPTMKRAHRNTRIKLTSIQKRITSRFSSA